MSFPHSPLPRTAPQIVVVGSINMDLMIRCQQLPRPGQTILVESAAELCGGKGANQAVAAARAGGRVSMIGCVGDDIYSHRLVENLQSDSINCQAVRSIPNCNSGLAIVAVESSGQNSIMVLPGANRHLSPEYVEQSQSLIQSADLLLVQLEIPIESVAVAIDIAKQADIPVVLNPAPAPCQWPGLLANKSAKSTEIRLEGISLICPNQTEAAQMTGMPVDTVQQAEMAARAIQSQGIETVVITLGDQGVLLFDGGSAQWFPAYSVPAIDTTAAGDAFAGALAVAWAESSDLNRAIRFASAAGALAVTRVGAQTAMASRAEIDALEIVPQNLKKK